MAFSGSSVPLPAGFSDNLAPSYNKVEMKPKAQYKKDRTFPPARKKTALQKSKSLLRPNVFPNVPPDHPQILI